MKNQIEELDKESMDQMGQKNYLDQETNARRHRVKQKQRNKSFGWEFHKMTARETDLNWRFLLAGRNRDFIDWRF